MNMQLGTSNTGLYGDIPDLFMLSACWRDMIAANSFATDGFSATDRTVRIASYQGNTSQQHRKVAGLMWERKRSERS
jgi:hypothetical protein